jgi:hypothetical protein
MFLNNRLTPSRAVIASVLFALATGLCSLNISAQSAVPNAVVASPITQGHDLLFDSSEPLGNHEKKYYKSCSIYIYLRSFLQVDIVNLSTYKVSSCPQSEFNKISAASVSAQLKTIAPITLVSMVGPYFQLMDENHSVIESEYVSIGNLNFSPVMYAEIGVKDLLSRAKSVFRWSKADASYNPIPTKRNMHFVWYKDSTIYTLVSDKGKRYVMTYFSPSDIDQIASEEEITAKLHHLPTVLNLPPGWKFEIVKLPKILRMHQILYQGLVGETLMDELSNIYMSTEDLDD